MFLTRIKYYCLLSVSLFFSVNTSAQLGGLGAPILNISFGQAAIGDPSVPGPALPLGYTAFPYTTDICPATGSYTIVSGINQKCFNNSWIPLLADNTPLPDNNGYMMLINDVAYSLPKILFLDTLKEAFCSGIDYQFSASVINVDNPSSGCIRFSSLTLQVEDNFGRVIASANTGDIQFAVYAMGYKFTKYVVDFRVPAGSGEIVVKIIDNPKSTSTNCSNGIAIDDIQLRITGPKMSIGFDSTLIGDWVKSTCFQDNRSFTMYGNIDPGIPNPAVQWQRSNDDGVTWMDIPGATSYTYSQDFPVPDTFFFRLRGSDASVINYSNCSISSNLLEVQVNGIPADFAVTNNSPICAGQDLIFNGEDGASYIWSGPNGFYDNIQFPHIYPSSLADSGMYYVQIITPGGCKATDSTYVKMIGTDVKLGPDQSVCKGQSVQLFADGGISFLWSPENGLSNAVIANPKATPDITTKYTVTVKDQFGCNNSGSVTVKLLNSIAVKASISSPDFLCRIYDSASFRDMSRGEIRNWHWDFGNGLSSSVQNPLTQNYSISDNTTDYTVRLAVTDTAGCTDTVYQVMKVEDNCYIAVPSAFTPNGDGLNDYLYPLNAYKATQLLFRVFNRNGVLVFETRDWTKKWDGTFRSNPQTTQIFVWELSYVDASNKKIFLKGSTLLIR